MLPTVRTLHILARPSLSVPDIDEVNGYLSQTKNWKEFTAQIELHAISSFALRNIMEHNLSVPEAVSLSLKSLALRHKLMAKARYKAIDELQRLFAQHNIPVVALKGLALAPMVYPENRFRPMRDMDIIVPRDQIMLGAKLMKEQLGYEMLEQESNKFMRDAHQMPNATKKFDGFTVSIELHHDALSRDIPESLTYDDLKDNLQTIKWFDIELSTLGHEQMLHQVTKHMSGTHGHALLKLINVVDVVAYAEHFIDDIDWLVVHSKYSHIINSLKCLHLIVPLSSHLQSEVGGISNVDMNGVGESVSLFRDVLRREKKWGNRFKKLFFPSDWWLHMYYNCDPSKSLLTVKLIKHPWSLVKWTLQRTLTGVKHS